MASRDGSDQHASTRPRAHLRRAVDVRDSCFGGPNRLGAWSPPSRAGTPPRRCCNRSLERTARRQLSCGICCHMTIHLGESVDMRANPDLNGSAACSPLLFPTIALSLCHECATWSCPRTVPGGMRPDSRRLTCANMTGQVPLEPATGGSKSRQSRCVPQMCHKPLSQG